MNVNIIDFDFLYIIRYHLSRGPKKSSKSTELKSEVKSTSYWRQLSTDLLLCKSTSYHNEDTC